MNRAILQGYSLKRYHMKYMRILTFCLEGCFLSQNTSTYSDWCQNDLKMINKTAMIFGLILYFLNVKKSSKTVFMKNIYHLFLLNEVDNKVVLNRNLQKLNHISNCFLCYETDIIVYFNTMKSKKPVLILAKNNRLNNF